MASDNPTADGSSRRPRTPPTLDLKAEEVRAAAASGTAPDADAPASTAPGESQPAGSEQDTASGAAPAGVPDATAVDEAGAAPAAADAGAEQAPEAESAPAAASQPEAPAPHPAERRRGGAGTVIAALVLGALAGGAVGGGIVYAFLQNAPPPVDLAPLAARVSVLEARPAADPAALAGLRQSLTKADARFAALDADIAALKAAPAAEAAPAPNLDALKEAMGNTEAAVADVSAQVATLRSGQDALRSAQEGLQSSVSAASSAAQQAQGQAQGLAPRLDSLSAHIEAVRKEAADAAGAAAAINRGAASILVLGNLKQAVDAGRPFAAELEAARSLLGPRAAPLEPFAATAQTGFPPLAALADRLSAAGTAAIDGLTPAPEAPPADASLVTRFLASAQGLVKLRPADGPDPESLRGILGRAAAAVRAGDMDTALATLKQLPAPVQEKLAAVAGEIDARRRAAAAAGALYQQALAAISGKAP